jgi:hypothetical protein
VRTPRWIGYFIQRPEAMLAFDDVNAAQYGPGSFGIKPAASP